MEFSFRKIEDSQSQTFFKKWALAEAFPENVKIVLQDNYF